MPILSKLPPRSFRGSPQGIILSVRQAVLYGAGDLRIEDRPLPAGPLEPDQVYVETMVSALSTGTDLGNYIGDSEYVPGAPAYPRFVGYSNCGRVVRVGDAVKTLTPGIRIFAIKPHQSAYIARESEVLTPVPEGVPAEEASLAYLAQLGLASLRQARYEAGESVAVIGLGVIGLCTVAVAKSLGATVTAVANSPARAETALRLGADRALQADQLAGQASADTDIVVLTANQWDAYRLAVGMARPEGRVSILGFPGRGQPAPDFNPLDPRWFYGKHLSLLAAGATSTLASNLTFLLDRMADNSLKLAPVISHRFPAERMREAYELARLHDGNLMAAVFLWNE
jgi:threonine dehydrogenase-like Zn-dependent dehydrogenase